ncbi:MAG: DUF1192 domain-containing protein [Rhizobiaceae bacterium]
MEEDESPKKQPTYSIGQDLSLLAVEEIDETIDLLKQEIERLQTERGTKAKHLSAAEALFKN